MDSARGAGFIPWPVLHVKNDLPKRLLDYVHRYLPIDDSIGQADTIRQGLEQLLLANEIQETDAVAVLNSDVVLMDPEIISRSFIGSIQMGFQCTLAVKNICDVRFFNPAMSYCYPSDRPWIFQEKPRYWIPGAQALVGFYMFAHAGRLLEYLNFYCQGDLYSEIKKEIYLSEMFDEYAHVTAAIPTKVADWGTPELLDADPDVLEWS